MTRDVISALRGIARHPVLAAVVIVSLGAGIGVNTVVFSWLQARVLHPLPEVRGANGFLLVEPRTDGGLNPGASWLEYRDLQERLGSFPELLAFRMVPLYLGEPGRVERAYGQFVSGNYFTALGLRPALGRFLRPDEVARPGTEPVAVISYPLWQKRFAGAPTAVGQTVPVNGKELTIVGVAPRRFQGTVLGLSFDMWVPATLAPVLLEGSLELQSRTVRGYSVMGRLDSTATQAQAQAELDGVMAQLALTYPESNAKVRGEVLTFWESPRGPQRLLAAALAALQAVMLLLLLAVCGNTANLVLARASARQREMGIRLALGATPWRVARLMLLESVVLALFGAGVGVAIAIWGTPGLIALPLSGLPIRFETDVNSAGIAFAVALGIACGLLSGAAPAFQVARLDPQVAFRAGFRSSGRSRVRNILMAVQVGLALIVLIIAGLFLRSFLETRDTDPGFRREGVLLAAYDLTGRARPADGGSFARTFAARVLDRLQSVPAIEGAAISSAVPLDVHGLPSRTFVAEGRARADGLLDEALSNIVTPGYLAVMGIPLVAGTDFADLEDARAPRQAIVNEAFVRRYLDGVPIDTAPGRTLLVRDASYTIAGVARNSVYNAFGEPPTPIVYFSYRDRPAMSGEIHVRARAGTEASLAADVRRVVRGLDPDLPLFNVRSLTDHVETNLVFRRVPARLFAVLGPLLLALAAIGIYASVSYTVSLRTAEVGVRIALGATAGGVIAYLVAQNLGIVVVGALVGWLITFVLALDVAGVETLDLSVFGGVPLLLMLVAAAACWLPAWRATHVDPMVAMRQE